MLQVGRAVLAHVGMAWRKTWRGDAPAARARKARLILVVLLAGGIVHAAAPIVPVITTVAGGGTGALGDGGMATSATLKKPLSVAVDATGNVYVADNEGRRVRKITPDGVISTVAGNGTGTYNGEMIPATSAGLMPNAVAVDAAGNLFIAESGRVSKVSTNGLISTVAGDGTHGYGGDGGPATAAQLYGAVDIALDRGGNLYIADSFNNRIRRVSADGTITTVAGNGAPVLSSCGCNGDGSAASLASVSDPQGLAFDANGNLYIAGQNGLRRIDNAGIIDTVAGGGPFGGNAMPNVFLHAKDIAFDSRGNIYFSHSNGLIMMLTVHGSLHVVAGTVDEATGGFIAQVGFAGDGGAATQALLDRPRGIALDAQDNLLIADSYNKRIRKVSAVPQPIEPPGMFMFKPVHRIPTRMEWEPISVISGDVTGDGLDDIILSNSANRNHSSYQTEFYAVTILVQRADGTLADPVDLYREWPATTPTQILGRGGLALADFNSDGVKDVVVSHGAGIELIPGSRTGSFGARPFSGVHTAPAQELQVMDVNRDGIVDVVARTTASAADSTQGIGVYFGNGMGEVSARSFMAVPFPFAGLAVGDLNGDGLKDIATGFAESEAGGVAVFLHTATSGFAPARKYNALDRGSTGIAIGDFNADGRNDVAMGQRNFINISNLSVFSQNAMGELMAPAALRTASNPEAMLATDINRDGLDDLLVVHMSNSAVGYYQQGTTTLSAEIKYEIPSVNLYQPGTIATGDVNHDGFKDVLTVVAVNGVAVLYGSGKREGIRVNGGQPLVRVGTGPATYQPVAQPARGLALTEGAGSQGAFRSASARIRLSAALARWSEPLRVTTISMGFRFLGTALLDSYSTLASQLQTALGRDPIRLSEAGSTRVQQAQAASESTGRIPLAVGSKASIRSRVVHRVVCLRAP